MSTNTSISYVHGWFWWPFVGVSGLKGGDDDWEDRSVGRWWEVEYDPKWRAARRGRLLDGRLWDEYPI